MTTITDRSVVVAVSEQISTELAGERVILHPETGQYHGLSGVASSIWDHIQAPISVGDVHELLLTEYDVDADQCREDLVSFLDELVVARLARVE